MSKGKYSTALTVVLIIVIIGIITIGIILSTRAYKNYTEDKNREKQIAEFQESVINNSKKEDNENIDENQEIIEITPIENVYEENYTQNTSGVKKAKLYNDEFPMIGTIYIDKTKAEYPILLDISPKALEHGVGVIYPSNPNLNEPGNTVIIGHNYRNGKFFSDNKELAIGDTIKITDLSGKTLIYTIYEIKNRPETDTEYITRERGNNIEISLSTCTDDGAERLVILARVEE